MKKERIVRHFAESLKVDLVKQIDRGELRVRDVSRIYQVSHTAVYKWLRKYSDLYKVKTRIVLEQKSLGKKNKELSEELKELERCLGRKQMRIDYLEKLLEIASSSLGDDFEKKSKRLS